MPTFNPDLAYTLPPVREALVTLEPLPEAWLPGLIEAINAHLEPPPSFDLATKMDQHVGDESTYVMKEQVIEGLKAIYWVMMDPKTSPDNKSAIAVKFIERAERCTPGFHDGVNSLVEGLARPASLDELLYLIRHQIVEKTATQTTQEVHSDTRFYTVAQEEGYGVRAINAKDAHFGDVLYATIRQKLTDAFARDYRFFAVLSGMEERIRSELFRREYTGAREAGYDSARMEQFLDFLTTLFKDAPVVIKQREAIARHLEYGQRIHEAMDSMRPAVRALIPALTNERFVEALIRDNFPEILKAKYIEGLGDESKAQIAGIQQDYKQVLGSEGMKALVARTNGSIDDRVSPFQSIEGGNLHLNWHQIRQTLWEEFRKQRYFILTDQEEMALNGLLDNSQPFNTEDCYVLALCGLAVIDLLSGCMLSDDKKRALLRWYILDAQEPPEDKLNNLPAIHDLGKLENVIRAALDGLELNLSALTEGLRTTFLNKLKALARWAPPIFLPNCLRGDRAFMLAAVLVCPEVFRQASSALQADREFVLAAVRTTGWVLEYVSAELKADREIVLAAVRKTYPALRYASYDLENNREFILDAVGENGYVLKYASAEFKADREIVLAAVRKTSRALRYASYDLENDREFILAAVGENGYALEYASAEFKADREIVLAAASKNRPAFEYASDELKADRRFMIEAVCQDYMLLDYASDVLKENRKFILAAVSQNGLVLRRASQAFKNDKEIVLAAVRQNGAAIYAAPDVLGRDKEISEAYYDNPIDYNPTVIAPKNPLNDAVSKTAFERILNSYKSKSMMGYLSTFWIFSWISPTRSQTMIELKALCSSISNEKVTRNQIKEAIYRGDNKSHRIRLFQGLREHENNGTGTDAVIIQLKDELNRLPEVH